MHFYHSLNFISKLNLYLQVSVHIKENYTSETCRKESKLKESTCTKFKVWWSQHRADDICALCPGSTGGSVWADRHVVPSSQRMLSKEKLGGSREARVAWGVREGLPEGLGAKQRAEGCCMRHEASEAWGKNILGKRNSQEGTVRETRETTGMPRTYCGKSFKPGIEALESKRAPAAR